jgi:CubicO group peptidase (beta-lactamase class C family)
MHASSRCRTFPLVLLTLVLFSCTTEPETAAPSVSEIIPQAAAILQGLEPQVPVTGDSGWTLEERMERYRVRAVSVAVFNDYEIVWAQAFGMADVFFNDTATTETLFQAGSISKPVAATAVLAAAQRGDLDLDTPINSILSSWQLPENEFTEQSPVTPRRLLSHSAGTTVHGFPGYAVDQPIPTTQQVLDGQTPANTAAVRVDTTPGTIFRYSGGGTTIMQLAMTDLTGLPFPELLEREVLGPIGMTHSTYQQPLPADWLERAAAGYQRDGRVIWGQRHTYPEMAAAGLWTTATDLAHFAIDMQRALRGDSDTVLSQETVTEMIQPVLGQSGLGFFEMKSNEAMYFGHNGADAGFQALLIASREGGHGAAIMVNSDSGIRLAMEMVPAIARAFDWPGFAPQPIEPAVVDPGSLEAMAGVYQVRDAVALEVRREGDQLLGRVLLDSESTRLVPRDDGTWIAQDDGSTLRFTLGGDGSVAGYLPADDPEATLRPRLADSEVTELMLLDEGRTDEALALMNSVGKTESSLNQLGYTLLGYNRADQAVAVFRLMTELHPGSANAFDSLGDGLLAVGDDAGASAAFRRVLETLPEDTQIPAELKPQVELRARGHLTRFGEEPSSQ